MGVEEVGNGRAMRRKAAVNYKATKILGSTVTAPRRRVKAVFPFTYITRVYNFDTSVELSVEDVEMLQKRREMELLRSILPPGNRQEMFAKMLEILNKQQSHEAERRTRHAHRPKKDAITALHSECIAPIEDPLLVAIRHNRLEEVYANLVSGKSYVADSHIQQAIQSNVSFEIAELLFCKYLNTFIVWRDAEEASTFLHLMAKLNRFPLMPVLHRWQPDLLNSKDRKGRTPLHVACINGHFESIKTLIGLGCDKNVKDADGYTPLLWSVEAPLKCALALLDGGADASITDRTGKSTLYWAVLRGHAGLAREFMERGIWFENRSLAHFATDMSLGLERFPVILDLRPMEDCRAHLLQHTRRSPLPLPSVAPGPSDIVSDEGSYGSSLTLTTSSPQSSDEGNVPDVTESSVRGPFRTRSRIMSEMFCSLASTPFEASSALRGRSSNSQTTQTTFKYPVSPAMLEHTMAQTPLIPKFVYSPFNLASEPHEKCVGCKCNGRCDLNPNCACKDKNGQKSPYRPDGTFDFNHPHIFECSRSCACNITCSLRTSQRGIYCPFVICQVAGKGLGVMTTTAIPAGTFVCEYSGAFVSQRILERKEERKQRLLSSGSRLNSQNESFVTYAIEINHKGVDYFVDSEQAGNMGRFFNHSCEPNMRPVKVDRGEQFPTLCFYTTENVPAGGELTWKYRHGSSRKSGQSCRCGSSRCGGYV